MFIRAIHQLATYRLFACLTIILVFLLAAHQISAQTTASISQPDLSKKNVLILHSFSYEQTAYLTMDPIFVRRFSEAGLDLNNVHFEFLDLGKHSGSQYWKETAKSLKLKYEGHAVDLIILLHATGLDFLIQECKGLFQGVPVIHLIATTNFTRENLRSDLEHQLRSLNQPFIVMPFQVDAQATVETILRLQPDTLKLIILGGGGPLEKRLAQTVRLQLEPLQGNLYIEYMSGLPMDEVLTRVGMATPKTAILFTTFYEDGTGKPFRPADAGRMISRAAKAPVFGLFETLVGDGGIVGGVMVNQGQDAERAASMAIDILKGKKITEPLTVMPTPLVPMFDRQQLDRWGFREKNLPPGSMVVNRPILFWVQYRGYIFGGVAIFLMQALLIIVLVVQRRQKRIVEQRLHEKNEELDQFFSVSLDLLCVANTDGYFVRLNPAFERLLGYTLQELMAKPFLSFVHPDDREATEKAIEGLKSQNVLNQFNNRYVCNDGTYRWLEWRAVQSSDLIYAAARDFTERKAVEETVRESENKYRSLYESMMDGYVLVSTDGKIKEYNESYREMLGYASEELNNLTYHELTPETWHSFEQVIVEEQVLPRGYSDVYEKEYIKKNGTIFPVELRTFLIRNETGRNVGMWAIVRDVTDRKRAGEALEERLAFEQLLSNLSARFVSISPDQMDTEIEGGLKQVLKFFQVERCGLLQISPDKASWQVTHVTLADNIPQVPLRMELPVSLFPYTYKTLIDEREVHSFSRLDDLPAEANVDWQTNVEWGIRSGLYIPITTAGHVVRVMAIDSVKSEHVWPEELVSRLRLLGEIFANALELAHTRLQIADRLRFECLVSDLSAGFVNLPPDQVDSEINKWLRIITEFFDADRCTIGLFSEDRTLLERVFEYHSSDSKPAVESISKEQMPWYIGQLLCGNPVVINRVEDLPPEAGKERHVCLVRGMKSILSIPMVVGGTTLGSFVLVSTRGERVWPEELVQRFRSVSDVFTNALQRRRSEMKLRTSEEKFRQFFSHIPEYSYIIAPDGMIIDANDQATNALGYNRGELIGKSFATLYAPESMPKMTELFDRWIEHEEIINEEMVVITKAGEKRIVLLNVGAVKNNDGTIIQFAAMQRDITEQKNAEIETLAARRELWHTDRLFRMGELTASLAHELNQPLTSILSNAKAAIRFIESDRIDMKELIEILEDIAADDKRAGDIIRSLRSMVRQEEGEQEVIAINDLLFETISLFNSEAVIRNVRIETSFADYLPSVKIVRIQLQQVVINLLMNAVESMMGELDNVNRRIVVETRVVDGNRVLVAIRDFGTGIEEPELIRIFESFFTTKRSGLGIGLSLARSIIEAQAGSIWAENNPDKGTTFYFELPGLKQ